MSAKIGPKGVLQLIDGEIGPKRPLRIHSFKGRADTGFIPVPQLRAGCPPIAYINMTTGLLVASVPFVGVVTGGLSQDTGAGNAAASTSRRTPAPWVCEHRYLVPARPICRIGPGFPPSNLRRSWCPIPMKINSRC